MKNLQKIGALLLCLLLLIGATACGADENANSTPNVGDNTTSSVNGGDSVSSETDDGDGEETSGMPQSGDPLTDFVGMWALAFGGRAQDSIYIKEDGTWGYQFELGDSLELGKAVYSKGVLYLEDDGDIFVLNNQDGHWIEKSGFEMIRYSDLYQKSESVPVSCVGYWKFEEADVWIVINDDATWYQLDADGNKTIEGFAMHLVEDDTDYLRMVSDTEPPFILEDEGGELGCMTFGHYGDLESVTTIPGGQGGDVESLLKYFAGVWQIIKVNEERNLPCIMIAADGTYQVIDNQNAVLAQGKIAPTAGKTVLLNADGTGETEWMLAEDGVMSNGSDGIAMVRLSGNGAPDPETMNKLTGSYLFSGYDNILTLNADATWQVTDKNGVKIESGVISQDKYQLLTNTVYVALIPDSGAYPYVFTSNNLGSEVTRGKLPSDQIPELMQYTGLWKFAYKDKEATVKLTVYRLFEGDQLYLQGADVDGDGNKVGEFDYEMYIDEEGNHVLYGDGAFNGKHGFLYKVHLDSDGCICNANDEKIMTPVQ